MKNIEELFDIVYDEIEMSKLYAEKCILLKAENKIDDFVMFERLAKESLEHAESIHQYTKEMIKKLKENYTIPAGFQKQWNYHNTQIREKTEWIKQVLSM